MSETVNPPGAAESFTRPPLAYPGNKSELADRLIQYFPEHETYVEPFCGSAAVLFNKKPSRNEVINDINSDLTTFLRVLRDNPHDLVEWLRQTPYSEEEYERVKKEWRRGKRPNDPVKHAGQVFLRRRASFGADVTGFRAVASGRKNSARQFSNARDRLLELTDRLDEVIIRNTDWRQIINDYASPSTFFYLDPPYRGAKHYYDCDFHPEELVLYFIHHFDGSDNTYIADKESEEVVPPEFYEFSEYTPVDDEYYLLDDLWVSIVPDEETVCIDEETYIHEDQVRISPADETITRGSDRYVASSAGEYVLESEVVTRGGDQYVKGENLTAGNLYQYGSPDDPLQVMISSDGPIEGLSPYVWSVKLNDYTHEINNIHDETEVVPETVQMNYDPESSDFTPFGGDAQQTLTTFN